ncbi:MAG: DUF262 domain-containing protein [Dorea sp.]|nr:DUF262 domain-containing protein [Dorea sp.]
MKKYARREKMLPEKYKKDLDKLINIAQNYREGTISNSLLIDVLSSQQNFKENIELCRKYLEENNISVVEEEEVEEMTDEINYTELIKPYDTTQIDISPKPLSLDMIISRLENEEIDLMPDFQRKAGLWSPEKKSQLIESLLLRIPLPAFYFDGSNNSKWVVIDGLQRLTALKEFFVDDESKLRLQGLEFLKELEGATIDDMPRAYVRRMKETQVITYIINPGAPINLKYNIFKRINTGGLELEPQEIRHALYQGFPARYLKELANLEEFKQATGYSVKTDRMLDREFVLRFLTFYGLGVLEYKGAIDLFLNAGMEMLNRKGFEKTDAGRIKIRFVMVLNVSKEIFGKFAFRRMPDLCKRRPISKALFETWTCILAECTEEELDSLVERKKNLIRKIKICFGVLASVLFPNLIGICLKYHVNIIP